jgi:alpha-tubulin suppressor-like RCC1 family protein
MKDENISQIACGSFHSIILKNNGEIYVFGRNDEDQLGLGHNKSQNVPQLLMNDEGISQIACGGYHSVILKSNGEMYVFGLNDEGQLGLGHNEHKNIPQLLMRDDGINQLACGGFHTIILKNNSDVYVFGDNQYGQLGLGHNEDQNVPQLLMGNVSLIANTIKKHKRWDHKCHQFYGDLFRQRILTFLLAHKRNQIRTGLRIPKFVLFEIIKEMSLKKLILTRSNGPIKTCQK